MPNKPSEPLLVVGSNPDNGETVGMTACQLLSHTLVLGGKRQGKTLLLAQFFAASRSMGFSNIVLDSKGKLYETTLNHMAKKRDLNALLWDATDFEQIMIFDPLRGRRIADPALSADLQTLISEAVLREPGRRLPKWPNWLKPIEVWFFFKELLPLNSYFIRSLLFRRRAIKLDQVLLEGKNLLVRIPRSLGSMVYRMLVFDSLLRNAAFTRPPALCLILVDSAYGFVSSRLNKAMLQKLAAHETGLVLSLTYDEMALLKRQSPTLYQTLLDEFGCIFALGSSEDVPKEVLQDVTLRLVSKPFRPM